MIFFDKPLLSLAAASLLLAAATAAPRAATASTAAPASGHGAQAGQAQSLSLLAQGYGLSRPPGEIGEAGGAPYPSDPADGAQPDSASLLVRIGRLESQVRQLNGQIEQMQFETRKLEEQLQKFQEDVDFRFREGGPSAPSAGPPQKRGEAAEPEANIDIRGLAQSSPALPPTRSSRRGDAFDPAQNPSAPGVPRPLGSQTPAAASGAAAGRSAGDGPAGLDPGDPGAPLDLSNGRSREAAAPAAEAAPRAAFPEAAPAGVSTPRGTMIAGLPGSPKEEFDIAMAYFKQRSYENAEQSFARYIEKNPKDKMVSEATYYLGESFFLLGRHREAAEQYLKIPARYPSSPHAPEALLRLGQSLNALGAKEQACATFSEIPRKYPNAPASVRSGAEREAKRSQC